METGGKEQMSESRFDELTAELRQRLDELALKTLLDDEGEAEGAGSVCGEVEQALRQVSELAAAAQRPEVAQMAGKLADGPSSEFAAGIRKLVEAVTSKAGPEPVSGEAQQQKSAAPSLIEDEELVSDFILESREHLANVEAQLLKLEREPGDQETLNSAFRSFHTIKGLAGFLDLGRIQEVAHEVENILDLARQQKLTLTPEVVDAVLAGGDYLRVAIEIVEASLTGGRLEFSETSELISRVRGVASLANVSEGSEPEGGEAGQTGEGGEEQSKSVAESAGERNDPETAEPSEAGTEAPEKPTAPQAESVTQSKSAEQAASGRGQAHAIKVSTGKLDYLVDMVGELVVAQSLLQHDPDMEKLKSSRLQRNLSQLSRITSDVQRTAMSMRMVPVGTLFRRYTRLVRDLARAEGKQVELVTRGEDTELDRNIIEELADPLMHMIRNGINHGLETPAERKAAGKPESGRIQLSAWHQSGFIMIELADDGRGIPRDKVLRKARERGMVAEDAELTDSEVQNLIFEPGFSTADAVSNVSGRGVGMDVVKRNILKLRGRVDVSSVEGRGTRFTLKMPLTLAIIDGLVVGVGKERYIVPIYTVREMLRPTSEQLSSLHNREEMVMVRGGLLPLVRLYRSFGVKPRSEDPAHGLVLVAETLGKRFCLLVDDLIGKQEVVIKSLGESLKNISGVAGGAILGDGTVGLILDMDGIFAGGSDA